jgi:hypothetical protein
VVAAHSNQAKHGKGRSIKASDVFVASLCHHCHFEIDQGKKLENVTRKFIWNMAHVLTVRKLVRMGLWPQLIDIPIANLWPLERDTQEEIVPDTTSEPV